MNHDQHRQEAERALAQVSCLYCGSIVTAQQVLHPGHCGAQSCMTSHIVKGAKARDAQRSQDYTERQDDAHVKSGAPLTRAAEALGRDLDSMMVAVVPFQNEPTEPLSDAQRRQFQTHIQSVVDEAFNTDPDPVAMMDYAPRTDDEPPIVAAGCAACQGYCCKRGGGDNHAFLTRQTVHYMRVNDPDLVPEEVVAHYLEALPDVSVRGACVFQGPQGCALERTWRAAICNAFYCHDIHAMHALTGGRADAALAIVGINDDVPGKVVAFSDVSGMIAFEGT
jgi:hypothetical protein